MLKEFITTNLTTNQYMVALIYLLVFFIIIKLGVFIVEKIILKLTMKSKTDLDDLIIEKSAKPVTVIALLFGIKIALGQLPWKEELVKIFNTSMDTLIGLFILVLFYRIFSISSTRIIKKVARKTKTSQNEALLQLVKSTLQVVLVLVGILYILKVWGIEIGPLLTGIGIGGLAIAFAMQSSLANIFGGVSIILDKSVQVGDLVKLEGGVTGKILNIGLRSTKVKTFDNEMIIVPNSKLADSNIQNIAQPEPKSRVVIPFGVAYGSNIEKVKKIVMKEIPTITGFTNDPEPTVKFLEMGNSSLSFKAFFFVESFEQRFGAIDEANTKIYNALNKAKIEIPFPQMDVHVKK
ncbi:MAG: mechanosensitive ion channel family protein [Nanoarchaeota archaeon]|jgi:MscS family membrane protein|nr:mechanosensitive ion channel family protein [Nanoarchaeota archaeon]